MLTGDRSVLAKLRKIVWKTAGRRKRSRNPHLCIKASPFNNSWSCSCVSIDETSRWAAQFKHLCNRLFSLYKYKWISRSIHHILPVLMFLKIWGGTYSWAISRNCGTHRGESHETWQEHYRNIFHPKIIIITTKIHSNQVEFSMFLNFERKMCSFVMKTSMQAKIINTIHFSFLGEIWPRRVLISLTLTTELQKRWKYLVGLARGQISQKGNGHLSWEIRN